MDLESARHAWLKPSFLHITSGYLWPEGASMPQTDFCMVLLRSKNRPATHQPQPFQKPNLWTLYTCVKVMNVVNSLHDPISSNHFVYHECQSERLAISASHCSEIPLHVWNIWNVSNLAILGRVACNLMRLGSLHSDIVAVQPQLGQRPVDSQRRSQSLDSMDDSKSLCFRTTCLRNSYHERVQNSNRTLWFALFGHFYTLQALQSIRIPWNQAMK